MANSLEPKVKRQEQQTLAQPTLLWVLLIALFAALIIGFGLSFGHSLVKRQARMIDSLQGYHLASSTTTPRTVRIILER